MPRLASPTCRREPALQRSTITVGPRRLPTARAHSAQACSRDHGRMRLPSSVTMAGRSRGWAWRRWAASYPLHRCLRGGLSSETTPTPSASADPAGRTYRHPPRHRSAARASVTSGSSSRPTARRPPHVRGGRPSRAGTKFSSALALEPLTSRTRPDQLTASTHRPQHPAHPIPPWRSGNRHREGEGLRRGAPASNAGARRLVSH
jgi:hypothetical protein